MKRWYYLLFLILFSFKTFSQTNQTFSNDNFKINCDCKLFRNEVFIQSIKKQGIKYPVSAYVCAADEEDFKKGMIININIFDHTSDYQKLSNKNHSVYDANLLKVYKDKLVNSGISIKETIFKGVPAIEYSFLQMDMPTKAIYFIRNKKSYLLQASTRTDLNSKFYSLKTTFIFI